MVYDLFERELQFALGRLFDPTYQPSVDFCQVLGCQAGEGNAGIRSRIQAAIEELKPPPDTPQTTIAHLVYDILYNRYILKLTQEETAYRLNVSRRTVNRIQRKATHMLCGGLWKQGQEHLSPTQSDNRQSAQEADWNAQLRQELNNLQTKAPKALSTIEEVLNDAIWIMNANKIGPEILIRNISIQPGLVAAVHPVLLEQVLIAVLKRLAPVAGKGGIAVFAKLEDGNAKITLTCSSSITDLQGEDLFNSIPILQDINITKIREGSQLFLWITMPSVGKLTVLVVDDNEDMIQFYRDCTIGTPYHIFHQPQGRELFQAVRENRPDIIVLDVMLPDIDGWRLLMHLRENPETRQIPVLVCSVIREEDLALSLGAAHFLSKPVNPAQFVQGLDLIRPRVEAEDPTGPESSEESGL